MDEASSKTERRSRLGQAVTVTSPKRPLLLYPDQSHLSDVAKGVLRDERKALEGLVGSGDIRLVLSAYHLIETSASDRKEGKVRAEILDYVDALEPDVQWLHMAHVIFEREVSEALEAYLEEREPRPIDPFARNLQDCVRSASDDKTLIWPKEYKPSEVADLLKKYGWVSELLRSWQAYGTNAKRFQEAGAQHTEGEWVRRRVIEQFAPVKLAKGTLSTKAERAKFAQEVRLECMSGLFVFQEAMGATASEVFRLMTPRSPKRSDVPDWHHVVALPYIDLFTCDAQVFDALRRSKLVKWGRGTAFPGLSQAIEEARKTIEASF